MSSIANLVAVPDTARPLPSVSAAAGDDAESVEDAGALLLSRAAELVPVLRERAAGAEQLRRIPDETLRDFHVAGLFRALKPKRFGGFELHPRVFFDICAQVAQGCASSAWVLGNLAYHHHFMALWPERAQEEVWAGNPDVLIGSSYVFARGTARKTSEGYVISGQWPFSSGIDPCEWCVVGAMTSDDDGSLPHQRYFLIPRSDYNILDTWHVVGLRATGSKDVLAKDVLVPAYRTVSFSEATSGKAPGLAVNPGALYRLAMQGVGGFVLMPVLYGAARAAADDYVERSRSRKTLVGSRSQADLPGVQDRVANVEAHLDAALLIAHRSWDDAMECLRTELVVDGRLGSRLRRDSAFAARLVVRAMDDVFAGSGGAGLSESGLVQRMWRDVHAGAAQFGLQWDVSGPAYGRVRLGLPSGMPGLGV